MARDFNGSTDRIDYVNVLDPNGQTQTLSFWIYPDSVVANQYFFTTHAAGDASVQGVLIWTDFEGGGGRINFISHHTGTNLQSHTGDSAFATDSWQHILITWDGSTTANNVNIYVDNSLQSLTQASDGSGDAQAGDGSWSIGGRITDDNRNFNARFANFGWWNRVLSAGEIAGLSNGNSPAFYRRGLKFAPDLVRHQRDPISGKAGTLDGTTVIEHPRTVFPMPAMAHFKAAAAPAVIFPVMSQEAIHQAAGVIQ